MSDQHDIELRDAISHALARESGLDGAAIGVAVHHGVVTLSGVVDCWADKHAAGLATFRVPNVQIVANEIQIEPSWSSTRSDGEIAEAVRAALRADGQLATQAIRVTLADGGDVTLSGHVDSIASRDSAAAITRGVAGVRFVTNVLEVADKGSHRTGYAR